MPAKETETHDPDTGEITDDRVAPGARIETQQATAATAPAACPPASASNPLQGTGPGAGAVAVEAPEPKTAAEYVATRRAWIENLLDADAGITTWDAEKELRGSLKVPTEMRTALQQSLKAKVAGLRGQQ
jgi:hypothetical protein